MIKIFTATGLLLGLQFLLAFSPAEAGRIRVVVDAGSTASVVVVGPGIPPFTDEAQEEGTKGPVGEVEFILPIEIQESDREVVIEVVRELDGESEIGWVEFEGDGQTIADLEPFVLPNFSTPDVPLFVVIDVIPFLSEMISFSVGDVVVVSNGITTETSSISFFEGTGLPTNPIFLLPGILDELVPFSGQVTVHSFDSYGRAIPEPPTLPILALGMVSLLFIARSRTSFGRCWL